MNIVRFEIFDRKRWVKNMNRLQKSFSRDLQNTLNLLGQSDIGSPIKSYQQFTHHNNSTKKSPIQIISTTLAQNSSKPKTKTKTKTKTKQNSSKLSTTTKRKTPTKKHPKKLPDQISLNSILENPISSDEPNIKRMFTLFHLERTYRQKKTEKIYNFYFYLWFKKLTRKLLKIRVDQQRSQSMIQSSSIIHISIPTADQLTQTECTSDSDSDIFNFSNDDVQDFPRAVDNLSDTQLIHKVITGSSIYNNDIEEDDDDSFLMQRKYSQRKNIEQEQNSFISWKSEQISNDVVDQACDLASTIIEKSISSDDLCKSGETLESIIARSITSKVKNGKNQISNYYNHEYDPEKGFSNHIFPGSSESNENSYEDDYNYNSTNLFNEFPSNEKDYDLNDEFYSKATSLQNNSYETHNSRKERNRPPPVDLDAKTVPMIISDTKPPDIVRPRPESELKKYLRNIITEEFFESVKYAQMRKDISLPLFVIPPNVQKPWQFTNEYCELIIDVVNEFAKITDLKNYTAEEFLDYLYNFFDKSHNQRNKTIFAELETLYQKKYDEFLLTYSIDFSDSLLQCQLDSVLGI